MQKVTFRSVKGYLLSRLVLTKDKTLYINRLAKYNFSQKFSPHFLAESGRNEWRERIKKYIKQPFRYFFMYL